MTELRLLSSMAPKELLRELVALYEQRGGTRVRLEAAGGVDVTQRVRQGEELDLVVLARNSVDELVRDGALEAASVRDIAASGIGVAVRTGAKRPDIADVEALKRAVMAARSLSFSTGPSGVYLEKLFAAWGVLQELKPRIVVPPPGAPVGQLVSAGKVELGFQQLSELIAVPGITVLGGLPAGVQLLTRFSGGVSHKSRDQRAAGDFLAFMSGAEHAAVRRHCGMQ